MSILNKHSLYYSIAALIQLIGLLVIIFFAHSPREQLATVVLMTFIFIFWALVHHKLHHDLQPKIVIEYFLMGALGISITYIVLR